MKNRQALRAIQFQRAKNGAIIVSTDANKLETNRTFRPPYLDASQPPGT